MVTGALGPSPLWTGSGLATAAALAGELRRRRT